MCSRNFPSQKCLSYVGNPTLGCFFIHFIPLPVSLPIPQPQGGAPDVTVMSPCSASLTKPYLLTTEISFSAKLAAHRGQHQATKAGGASTSTKQLCSEQILREGQGAGRKPLS